MLSDLVEQMSCLIDCRGEPCDYGCTEEELPGMIERGKELYPYKPYRIIRKWSWADIAVNETEMRLLKEEGLEPAFVFANEVVKDETGQFRNAVKTTTLTAFHNNCLFVTRNTVYVLLGRGHRTTVDIAVYNISFF